LENIVAFNSTLSSTFICPDVVAGSRNQSLIFGVPSDEEERVLTNMPSPTLLTHTFQAGNNYPHISEPDQELIHLIQ
jgi:hypothetical protein